MSTIGGDGGDGHTRAKLSPPAGRAAVGKSKAAYAADQGARVKFLAKLGMTDRWGVARYHENCLVRPRIPDPLAGGDSLTTLEYARADFDDRKRSMPSFGFFWHRVRSALPDRVKVWSALFKSVGKNADAACDAVIVQHQIVAALEQRLSEESALLAMLEVHRVQALRHEKNAISAMPKAADTAARLLELHGLDRQFYPASGHEFARELLTLLRKHSTREAVDPDVERRLVGRLSATLETPAAASEIDTESDYDASYWDEFGHEDVEPDNDPRGEKIDPLSVLSSAMSDRKHEPVSAETTAAVQPLYNAHHERALGHGMIIGLTPQTAFSGLFTLPDLTADDQNVDVAAAAMPMRPNPDLRALRVMPDGSVDAQAWARFEVATGPYTLRQIRGRHPRLPPYHRALSMPPFIELARYGRLIKASGLKIADLAMWDAPGDELPHLRQHFLNGAGGDPELAFAVMRRAVREYHDLNARMYGFAELSSDQVDERAKFWLFLTTGRMRPNAAIALWGEGFFDDVAGDDPVLEGRAHWLIARN